MVRSVEEMLKARGMQGVYGKKTIHVQVPANLHLMVHKLACDEGISITEIIVRYLKYLRAKPYRERRLLDAKSAPDFTLDDTSFE